MIVGFVGVFPYLLPGYTAMDSSSSELTLKIMLVVTLIFLPIVLAYTGWKFYRFRAKIEE